MRWSILSDSLRPAASLRRRGGRPAGPAHVATTATNAECAEHQRTHACWRTVLMRTSAKGAAGTRPARRSLQGVGWGRRGGSQEVGRAWKGREWGQGRGAHGNITGTPCAERSGAVASAAAAAGDAFVLCTWGRSNLSEQTPNPLTAHTTAGACTHITAATAAFHPLDTLLQQQVAYPPPAPSLPAVPAAPWLPGRCCWLDGR